jgi:uncharacterized metal-binding protein
MPNLDCVTCEVRICRDGEDCLGLREAIAALYDDPQRRRTARTAAWIEAYLYGESCRLEELIEFAKRMEYRRLGVAFCVGLAEEAKHLVEILRRHFDVIGVCCKVCGIVEGELQEIKARKGMSPASCNPLGQAEILNHEQTDLNILVGLCIGHDILFTDRSQAPVTTFIVKDRLLAHNPAGALYSRYLRRRLEQRAPSTGGET